MRATIVMPIVAAAALYLVACGGASYRLTSTHVEPAATPKPIRDPLIIVVVDDQQIRGIFENHFKDWFKVKGVEAITSVDVLPIQKDSQLEEEAIVAVVDKYENDSVLITHLVGFGETDVFSRGTPQVYHNYYSFYRYAWGYVHWPVITGENVQFTLETRLYSVSTESLLWAGESLLTNPETTGKAIGQVVESVIKALDKNGLLPKRPS